MQIYLSQNANIFVQKCKYICLKLKSVFVKVESVGHGADELQDECVSDFSAWEEATVTVRRTLVLMLIMLLMTIMMILGRGNHHGEDIINNFFLYFVS